MADRRRVKSRSGCKTCKIRRIKCDETQPSCTQCTHKHLDCPGYARRWKWSTKHEARGHKSLRPKPRPNQSGPSAQGRDEDAVENGSPSLEPRKSLCPLEGTGRGPPLPTSTSPVESSFEITDQDFTVLDVGTGTDICLPTPSTSPVESTFKIMDQDFTVLDLETGIESRWHPLMGCIFEPQAQVDFFNDTICRALCAYDSLKNPFRAITSFRARKSSLIHTLCRFLTTSFLSPTKAPGASHVWMLRDVQTETLCRLRKEVASLDDARTIKQEELLMAIIMFGLALNWDGSNEPSLVHYNAAVSLCHRIYPNQLDNSSQNGSQRFFGQALIYWWMGLAFITDVTEENLLDPPFANKRDRVGIKWDLSKKIMPHPVAGVSPHAQYFLGCVGSLVYTQRKKHKTSFPTIHDMRTHFNAVKMATTLEEHVLSLKNPEALCFQEIDDPDTPLVDLINTSEVHRLASLILLYHTFPDLLYNRMMSDFQSAMIFAPGRRQWLSGLTALAVHALDILCKNGPNSGARSIEPLLLVIIGGELRLPQAPTRGKSVQVGLEGVRSSERPRSSTSDTVPDCELSSDRNLPDDQDLCQTIVKILRTEAELDAERIVAARSTVLSRLKAIRERLPYKSLQLIEELVLKTWNLSDKETADALWVDVMIANGWQFLMI